MAATLSRLSTLSPLAIQLRETVGVWSRSQYELVVLAAELVDLAKTVSAADLGRAIAAWLQQSSDPDALENCHQMRRSIKWRNDDG